MTAKINSRAKGQRAERKAIELLQGVIDKVWGDREDKPFLERNQNQSNKGGYDVIGLDWLALEVKHQEKLDVDKWWEQCLKQCRKNQIPVLMYKQNGRQFTVRLWGRTAYTIKQICIDIKQDDFISLFETLVREEYTTRC